MTQEELDEILKSHKLWLETGCRKGAQADLRCVDLHDADLRGADLRCALLCNADLRWAVLSNADLRNADLFNADLRHADLCNAILCEADLKHADLYDATLAGADLRGADLDFASWPLWCGSLKAKIDKRIACQLLYHALRAMQSVDDEACRTVCGVRENIALANQFHLTEECGEISLPARGKDKGKKADDQD